MDVCINKDIMYTSKYALKYVNKCKYSKFEVIRMNIWLSHCV